ncbi:MAG: hypothetical protein R2734_02750 [Nocardioides sp.]
MLCRHVLWALPDPEAVLQVGEAAGAWDASGAGRGPLAHRRGAHRCRGPALARAGCSGVVRHLPEVDSGAAL